MGIIALVLVAAVGYFIYKLYRDGSLDKSAGTRNRSAVDIAEERYARGEIDREELNRIKEDLS